ncbi:MAG: GlxA family transcriptional regulator [Devosia sp.]
MRPPAPSASSKPPAARLRVGFILANHFTLTAFSTFVDTLRLAADEGDGSRQIHSSWSVMSASGKPVRASCGVALLPQSELLAPGRFDYIAVIGGLLHKGSQIDAATAAYLKSAAAAGVPLIGVCTGSFVLARAGLMAGRPCCVSWYHHRDLIDEFDDVTPVSDRIFLDDGDRITCSGGAGAADLAAMLVQRHIGGSSARKSLNVLLFDAPRPASSTQPAPPYVLQGASERVRRATLLMEQNLAAPLPTTTIAARLDMSVRQLDRLFHTELGIGPASVYRAMRVEHGRWMLQGVGQSIADVASLTGFADAAHFSRAFRKQFGVSPSQWRQTAAPAASGAAERRIY